jgi:hypothetical protein
MDVVESCLALVPVPYISNAFAIFRIIWVSVQQAKTSNEQLRALSYTVAQLLRALDTEYRDQKLTKARTSAQLDELDRLV